MYRRSDPRFRRTLNEISQTFESANESAQANVYSFSHNYVSPCFDSLTGCLNACTAPCFPARDLRRRSRARSRGRAELSFDFYDDWEADGDDDGLLGWSNDEYDGLLGAQRSYGTTTTTTTTQPGRQRAMSYGARRGNRHKSQQHELDDPTVIPAASYWGLFGKLTGKLGGGKSLRYKPSAADLQEHPGANYSIPEGEPLLEEEEDEGRARARGHGRTRSGTQGSGTTTDSLSSRGDIFPSDDELDDAIPLDDEFAMVLERRTTNSGTDEASSGKKGKRPSAASRISTRTASSRSSRNSKRLSRTCSSESHYAHVAAEEEPKIIPSLAELRREEERAQREEEADITRRREAAQRLATDQGMSGAPSPVYLTTEKKLPTSTHAHDETPLETPGSEGTTPFPPFDPPPMEEQSLVAKLPKTRSNHSPTEDDEFNPAQLPRLSRSSTDAPNER